MCEAGACPSTAPKKGVCATFKVTNACVDGSPEVESDFQGKNDWCGADYSHEQCKQNPDSCAENTNDPKRAHTNHYGYAAHFDLQNINNQLSALGWVDGSSNALNAEVTWEAVACDDPEVGFKGPNDYVGDCPVSSVNSFDELQSAADPQWS